MTTAIEYDACETYLRHSEDEKLLAEVLQGITPNTTVIVTEGFEERSLGVLQVLARAGIKAGEVVIGRYDTGDDLNRVYRERFEQFAECVAPGKWKIVANHNDGHWLREPVSTARGAIVMDITGVSNRAMFPSLDVLGACDKPVYVAYSEAEDYWPKRPDWRRLRRQLKTHESLSELVDTQPWLFSYEHRVELVSGHEGYDASGTGRALVGFLAFKCARLAAVLATEDYASMIFIAGRPPNPGRVWRVEALKEINESLTKGWPVLEMNTFRYREALRALMDLLLREDSLLWRYDVHFAAIGSKLQTVASWVLSCIVPSITMVTSVPSRYYREAFSEGIGPS